MSGPAQSFLFLPIAALATLILRWETAKSRWAPFFIIHAAIAVALPLWAGLVPMGNVPVSLRENWKAIAAFAGLIVLWESVFCDIVYEKVILARLRRGGDPDWAPSAAVEQALDAGARRLGLTPGTTRAIFALYALLWAPIAEQLFFWGWLHPSLQRVVTFPPASALTALLFACHHLLYLGGSLLPARASTAAFALSGLGTGLLMGGLLHLTRSLPCLMAAHLAGNVAWMALAALQEKRGVGRKP